MDLDRARGALLGLACGDALGRPVEFRSPGAIAAEYGTLDGMVGNGTHGQPAGTVTDDTDLALCIARSLVETGGFDPADVGRRFVAWLDAGPFDVGGMTHDAIAEIRSGTPATEAGQRVWSRSPEGSNAGNGSVMRCVPHALAFAGDRDALARVSHASSRITHADPRCAAGCAVLNLTVAALLTGRNDAAAALSDALAAVDDVPGTLYTALRKVPDGVDPDGLENSGYVVHTLQTSLHDALTADSAEAAVVRSVNRGGDSDTLGAVTGAVAGARFGADTLPGRWTSELRTTDGDPLADELRDLGTKLAEGDFG